MTEEKKDSLLEQVIEHLNKAENAAHTAKDEAREAKDVVRDVVEQDWPASRAVIYPSYPTGTPVPPEGTGGGAPHDGPTLPGGYPGYPTPADPGYPDPPSGSGSGLPGDPSTTRPDY